VVVAQDGDGRVEYGRRQKEVDKVRIELPAASLHEPCDGFVGALGAAVSTRERHCVERVGDRHHARGDGNGGSAQLPWITGPVPSLVMRQDALGEVGIERRERSQHVRATLWVRLHGTQLLRRQVRVIVNDVEQRLVDLSNVVKQRDSFDGGLLVRIEIGGVREDERITRDAAHVAAGFGVVRIDGAEERLQDGGGESFCGKAVMALAHEEHAGGGSRRELEHSALEGFRHDPGTRKKRTTC